MSLHSLKHKKKWAAGFRFSRGHLNSHWTHGLQLVSSSAALHKLGTPLKTERTQSLESTHIQWKHQTNVSHFTTTTFRWCLFFFSGNRYLFMTGTRSLFCLACLGEQSGCLDPLFLGPGLQPPGTHHITCPRRPRVLSESTMNNLHIRIREQSEAAEFAAGFAQARWWWRGPEDPWWITTDPWTAKCTF